MVSVFRGEYEQIWICRRRQRMNIPVYWMLVSITRQQTYNKLARLYRDNISAWPSWSILLLNCMAVYMYIPHVWTCTASSVYINIYLQSCTDMNLYIVTPRLPPYPCTQTAWSERQDEVPLVPYWMCTTPNANAGRLWRWVRGGSGYVEVGLRAWMNWRCIDT